MEATSALDETTLARMRAEAAHEAGPFIDPAYFRRAQSELAAVPARWLDRVIGRPAGTWHSLSNAELVLALEAAQADAEHLRALAEESRSAWLLAEARREGERHRAAQAARDEWEALRGRLPVPVAILHNWTARHLDGYEQGGDHIVVLEDLHAGRLHRAAGSPLCWTPSRAHELRHVSANTGDERRLPDCKACLRHAERLAAAS